MFLNRIVLNDGEITANNVDVMLPANLCFFLSGDLNVQETEEDKTGYIASNNLQYFISKSKSELEKLESFSELYNFLFQSNLRHKVVKKNNFISWFGAVFSLGANGYEEVSTLGLDLYPVVFNSNGKKVPDEDVLLLRNNNGKDIFILISKRYFNKLEEKKLKTVILYPKFYNGVGDIESKVSYNKDHYEITINGNSIKNIDDISVYFNGYELSHSSLIVERKKEIAKKAEQSSKKTLVGRRFSSNYDYSEDILLNRANPLPISNSKISFDVYLKEDNKKTFSVVKRNSLKLTKDRFTSFDFINNSYFDTSGNLVFPENNNMDVLECLPRFNRNKYLIASISGSHLSSLKELLKNNGAESFIKKIQYSTKIITRNSLNYSKYELDIFGYDENKATTYFCNEKNFLSITSFDSFNNYYFLLTFPEEIDEIAQYESDSTTAITFNNIFNTITQDPNNLINDEELLSYSNAKDSKDKEGEEREIILYDKDKYNDLIYEEEPYFKLKEGKVSINGFGHSNIKELNTQYTGLFSLESSKRDALKNKLISVNKFLNSEVYEKINSTFNSLLTTSEYTTGIKTKEFQYIPGFIYILFDTQESGINKEMSIKFKKDQEIFEEVIFTKENSVSLLFNTEYYGDYSSMVISINGANISEIKSF